MTEHFDRIVIGGGAMGLATTWQLAVRGLRVLMLERFTPGHERGASHGATRNMNNAYAEPHYLDLYDEALTLWRALERRSGKQLLTMCGLVTHGDPARVRAAHAALTARDAATELITPAAAAARWPGMRFEGEVLVNRDAGRIHARTALEVIGALATADGADLRYEHRVTSINEAPDRVTVTASLPGGETAQFEAPGVVVTTGAWSEPVLGGLAVADQLPPLRVTEEHPAHFAARAGFEGAEFDSAPSDGAAFDSSGPEGAAFDSSGFDGAGVDDAGVNGAATEGAEWPSFNHFRRASELTGYAGNVYGMLTHGEGIKVGFHATGDTVDPDQREFRAPDAARAQLREYVDEWFPGLDSDSAAWVSCTYTMTPSERFVLDRAGRVTVGAGFSGQGFKFVPAVGRVLADLSVGAGVAPAAFSFASHRA
ncbi:FAD-dependent oxidoreductase [Leucobacter sp. HY1908]